MSQKPSTWDLCLVTFRRHAMETLSALPTLRDDNSLVIGGFPSQLAGIAVFDVLFDFSLNNPDSQVHRADMGPTGPRWAPCRPHELCYLGNNWYKCRVADLRRHDGHGDVIAMGEVHFTVKNVKNPVAVCGETTASIHKCSIPVIKGPLNHILDVFCCRVCFQMSWMLLMFCLYTRLC